MSTGDPVEQYAGAPNLLTLTAALRWLRSVTKQAIKSSAITLQNTAWVAKNGADTGAKAGVLGRIDRPFLTVQAAIDAAAGTSGVSILVMPGRYTQATFTFPAAWNGSILGYGSTLKALNNVGETIGNVILDGTVVWAPNDTFDNALFLQGVEVTGDIHVDAIDPAAAAFANASLKNIYCRSFRFTNLNRVEACDVQAHATSTLGTVAQADLNDVSVLGGDSALMQVSWTNTSPQTRQETRFTACQLGGLVLTGSVTVVLDPSNTIEGGVTANFGSAGDDSAVVRLAARCKGDVGLNIQFGDAIDLSHGQFEGNVTAGAASPPESTIDIPAFGASFAAGFTVTVNAGLNLDARMAMLRGTLAGSGAIDRQIVEFFAVTLDGTGNPVVLPIAPALPQAGYVAVMAAGTAGLRLHAGAASVSSFTLVTENATVGTVNVALLRPITGA